MSASTSDGTTTSDSPGLDGWYVHDGTAWTTRAGSQPARTGARQSHARLRKRLRYRPLWQWVVLGAVAIGAVFAWLLAVSGAHGLPCH
jgi:hypothetical protein